MGAILSLIMESFTGRPKWSVEEVPDLSGKVILVTGGNNGIGLETCKVLLNKGAKVYMTARTQEKADRAIEWLKSETNGRSPVFLQIDLADLGSVRRAAEEFKNKEQELHVLYNNAGVLMTPPDARTADGYELQFGTNVLGHYLLTTLLLPTLIHTAQTSPHANGTVRVVNTSSTMQWMAPGINYASLAPNSPQAEAACRKLGPTGLYSQSKWANVVFSNELVRRYGSQGIISTSVHPGSISNQHNTAIPGIIGWVVRTWILNPTSWGALPLLYAGILAEGSSVSGKYVIPWGRVSPAQGNTLDEKLGQELWAWLEEQVKLH